MKHEKISPAGATNGANVLLGGEPAPYSGTGPKNQVSWLKVGADCGPVHLLTNHGQARPVVMLGVHPDKVVVMIANLPWGWSDLTREFLGSTVKSACVLSYARHLVERLQAASAKAKERHDRKAKERWRNRLGINWEGGAK